MEIQNLGSKWSTKWIKMWFRASQCWALEADLISASEVDGISLLYAGTTAICILRQIHSSVVWVACVGDSRVIHLSGDGRVTFSTTDHKPSDPVERERVLKHGCEITVSVAGNGEELEKIVRDSETQVERDSKVSSAELLPRFWKESEPGLSTTHFGQFRLDRTFPALGILLFCRPSAWLEKLDVRRSWASPDLWGIFGSSADG